MMTRIGQHRFTARMQQKEESNNKERKWPAWLFVERGIEAHVLC
jgi:hypothetical protein